MAEEGAFRLPMVPEAAFSPAAGRPALERLRRVPLRYTNVRAMRGVSHAPRDPQ